MRILRSSIPLVDAPVSGGVKKAIDGSLALMAGGDPAVVDRCRKLLEPMGKVFVTGGPGTGHAMKSMNNFLSAANLAVAAEAVIAGQRFGLDPKTMIDIFNASTGRNTGTDSKFPNNVLPRTFNSGLRARAHGEGPAPRARSGKLHERAGGPARSPAPTSGRRRRSSSAARPTTPKW